MKQEHKVGLYVTIIAHLLVIIVFLCIRIGSAVAPGERMLLDFSGFEEKEKAKKQEKLAQEVSDGLDEMIKARQQALRNQDSREIRNVAVDASSSDAETRKLYEDAKRLQSDLANGKSLAELEKEYVDTGASNEGASQEGPKYKGPSVVSYSLDGRKAIHLAIPAYQCFGGGDVTVIVTVNNQGRVTAARVFDELSSQDSCLREYALKAARASRFTASTTAPAKLQGEITYRFIAQ